MLSSFASRFYKFNVPLLFLESKRKAFLRYKLAEAGSQTRFRGRVAVVPDINLDAFRCIAVIDYVVIEVRLGKATQGKHLNKRLSEVDCQRIFAQSAAEGAPYTTDHFRLRFQEPSLKRLKESVSMLEREYGLTGDVLIHELEVSVDFFAKEPSQEAVDLISGVLKRHFLPLRGQRDGDRTAPRYPVEIALKERKTIKMKGAQFVYGKERGLFNLSGETTYRQAAVDRTLYYGKQGSDISWRVQRKDTDNRQPDGTATDLELSEQRGRLEVTLAGGELMSRGLTTLDALQGFKFESLRKYCFQTYLPTFPDAIGSALPLRHALFTRNERIFREGGCYGLDHWQRRHISGRIRVRQKAFDKSSRPGAKTKRLTSMQNQKTGYMRAYDEMNAKIEQALRQLSYRYK